MGFISQDQYYELYLYLKESSYFVDLSTLLLTPKLRVVNANKM